MSRSTRVGRASVKVSGLLLVALSTPIGPGLSAQGARIELRETVSIGELEGAEAYLFGRVSDLVVDPAAEEVHVADAQAGEIRVFSIDGTFLRKWGRPGQGPGEFQGSLTGIALRGDTVVAVDGTRLHLFDRSGEVLDAVVVTTHSRISVLTEVEATRSGWMVFAREAEPDGSQTLRAYAIEGPGPATHAATVPFDPGGMTGDRPRMTVTGGELIRSVPGTYAFVVGSVDAVADTIRIPHESSTLSESLVESARDHLRAECEASRMPTRCRAGMDDRIAEVRSRVGDPVPPVGGIVGSREGAVLVQRSDLTPDPFSREVRPFDIVSSAGEIVGSGEFPPGFRPYWFDASTIWGVLADELGVQRVKKFTWRVAPGG